MDFFHRFWEEPAQSLELLAAAKQSFPKLSRNIQIQMELFMLDVENVGTRWLRYVIKPKLCMFEPLFSRLPCFFLES